MSDKSRGMDKTWVYSSIIEAHELRGAKEDWN